MADVGTSGSVADTIFALSSGPLPAAIAVVRVSGPRAIDAVEALVGPLPAVRQARLRRIVDPASGELLDEGLVLRFPEGGSETGEDLVEIHCHGSRAAVRGVEEALARMEGLRLAEPGEFTRRAFLNGKTDLARIEGLSDLIHAETAPQRQAAMAMMGGALSNRISQWSQQLGVISAQLEAVLNFADEGDVEDRVLHSFVKHHVKDVTDEIAKELQKPTAERLKQGIRVVIAGPPNAGKSTLLNALAGREAAIVSPIAGTTRDVIEVPVALGGTPFLLADTAGLRDDSEDDIERIGMERAERMLSAADIIVWLGDPEDAPDRPVTVLIVQTKADLTDQGTEWGPCALARLSVSAVTGKGMDDLAWALINEATKLLPRPGDYALSVRQRAVLSRAHSALSDATEIDDDVLIAESLRSAMIALDEITGRSSTEAMLDELFSGFCIGK